MRAHLIHIDRAIARLLDERARLCAAAEEERGVLPGVDDLMRRADGAFPAAALGEVFEAVARGSVEALREAQQ